MGRRVSPSMLVACAALFFSMTGGAFAAGHFLITSKQQIAPWVRHALHGQRGPRGFQGPQGAPGTVDFGRLQRAVSPPVQLTPGAPAGITDATCPAGFAILNGGYTGTNEIATQSFAKDPNEWAVWAHLEPGAQSGSVSVWAECVPAG